MNKIFILFLIFLCFLINCSDQSSNNISEDEEILNLVYSAYKFPENFYTEDLDGGSIYYENTVSVKPVNQRDAWFELSTNSRDTAFYWSELSDQYSAYHREFVSERETKKYFEFKRVYEKNPTDIILDRVHKLCYLDRSMYDYFDPGEILGIYNERPLTLQNIKELIEYLIYIRNYNNNSYKVLKSYTADQQNRYVHYITDIIISYGDWGINDKISVWDREYFIDKQTGNITFKSKLIKTIQGHLN